MTVEICTSLIINDNVIHIQNSFDGGIRLLQYVETEHHSIVINCPAM